MLTPCRWSSLHSTFRVKGLGTLKSDQSPVGGPPSPWTTGSRVPPCRDLRVPSLPPPPPMPQSSSFGSCVPSSSLSPVSASPLGTLCPPPQPSTEMTLELQRGQNLLSASLTGPDPRPRGLPASSQALRLLGCARLCPSLCIFLPRDLSLNSVSTRTHALLCHMLVLTGCWCLGNPWNQSSWPRMPWPLPRNTQHQEEPGPCAPH